MGKEEKKRIIKEVVRIVDKAETGGLIGAVLCREGNDKITSRNPDIIALGREKK